jgi:L-histidine N-alpha-methyltransferase
MAIQWNSFGEKVMSQKILFTNQFARDVVRGLSKKHKEIPSKYFYDKNGSQIFTEIMKLPEYYLTNSETEIFNLHKESIVQRNQGKIIFIELGAGDASKTSILLEEFVRLDKILKYIPVDISNTAIMLLKNNISEKLFKLDIEPLEIDFMKELPKIDFPNQKVIIAYLGSSLGNLSFQKSITLLKKINTILKIGDEVMIGLDLIKDLELIQTAYNDFSGVTSKFNLNILQRMNSELGANFKADQFFHHASYHPREKSMHSHLIAKQYQTVYFELFNREFHFQPYESIFLERSCKYSMHDIKNLAHRSGFEIDDFYEDSKGWFVNAFFKKNKES